jgi:hypothetical protein
VTLQFISYEENEVLRIRSQGLTHTLFSHFLHNLPMGPPIVFVHMKPIQPSVM